MVLNYVTPFQYIRSFHFILSFHILDRPDMVNASTIRFDFLSFFTIRITWESPNDNFNEINKYELRFTSPSNIPSLFTIQPVFEFDTPEPNVNYMIDITACNEVGCGDVSETVQFSSITASLFVYPFVCLSICLTICLSVCPSVCLSVCHCVQQ